VADANRGLVIARRIATATVGSHGIFDVVRHRLRTPEGEREVHCLRVADWATVVAVTADRQVVLVRQQRFGIDAVTLETPGGIVEASEKPQQAAARELLEETGYRPTVMESMGWVHPNPALQDNRIHLVLARDAVRVAEPAPDEHESVVVVTMPADELEAALMAGEFRHALSALALERALARYL
jgi:8-oxo-dGTP pyrophosphatase MutT (NUDIX family)